MNVSPQRLWWSRRLTPAALICLSLTGALLPAQAALAAPARAAKPADQLIAVSCPTKRMCVAVGTTDFGQGMLAERWNGRRWATMRLAQPTGAASDGLEGVSCTSARACTAVGYDFGPGVSQTLAERWNGSRWRVQPTPNPGIAGLPFAAVSCGSATSCTAVGYYSYNLLGVTNNMLAEHWDGQSWSMQSLPPVGDIGGDLGSISCRPSACTAAGYVNGQSDEGPGTAPLAMRWNGTAWALQPTPGDATQNDTSGLTGISCPSARSCTAVGVSDQGGPLILRWNGATWHSQTVTNFALNYAFNAVSCTSASACMAIGSSAAARWNGHRWSSRSIRVPPGAHGFSLSAVSCASASRCTAVGFKNMTVSLVTDLLTVAERWNGHTWARQATRSP